jgi:Rps23 Pro-64 3,4-dihydroxylase Tpa1-like proline 4-hydroxylase/glycosyltransferase involved in cell wall biosynthesis
MLSNVNLSIEDILKVSPVTEDPKPVNLKDTYNSSKPFPHIVIDNFVDPTLLEDIINEFNTYEFFGHDPNSTQFQVKKLFSPHSAENLKEMPTKTKGLIDHFNSKEFIQYLEKVTGIKGLQPDPTLLGAGMHRIKSGGKLSVHADSSKHAETGLYRRINLLLYLNKNWNPDWGGSLQLYDKDMKLQSEIQPLFNRAVIFNTTKDSYHGHPYELNTPEEVYRDSIALYYYTEDMPAEEKAEVTSAVWKDLPKAESLTKAKPTVVFATMCKNEEHCILETLKSVAPYIDYWIVCDTGSTDKTVEMVKTFFAERGIPGELHEDSWVGFDHNKTLMIQRAKGKADYIMHLDADDQLVGEFQFAPEEAGKDTYYIPVRRGGAEWKALILFKGDYTWKFCGVAHTTIRALEIPSFSIGDLSHYGYYISGEGIGSRAFDPKKYLYDAERLQKQFWDTLISDPDSLNNRSIFYTAQSYMDYGMHKEGLQWNRLYLKVQDTWIEERFEAQMRVAQCLMSLEGDLSEIVTEMNKAIEIFPDRSEPYVHLGRYLNLKSQHELAYRYLKQATLSSIEDIKEKYVLFVNKYCYGKHINDELSVACFWTGKYEEGKRYLEEIINDPEFESQKERLQTNLVHFNNRLNGN